MAPSRSDRQTCRARSVGFRAWGLGLGGIGFRVWGLGLRGLGFKVCFGSACCAVALKLAV